MIVFPSAAPAAASRAFGTSNTPAVGTPAAFRVPGPEPAPSARPAASAVRTAPLDSSLLLFQEQRGNEQDDRDGREHAGVLLDALRALQRAVLSAGDADSAAAALHALLDDAPAARDPRLRELLRSVSLRARIELQRRSRPGPT